MSQSQVFLLAMLIIFSVPYLLWRLSRTDHYAPLVVVQIITGILLGPGVLGAWQPEYYQFVFTADTVRLLNGIAWWAVMLFVWLAGMELDAKSAWHYRRESIITSALALCVPLAAGCLVAMGLLRLPGWIGVGARPWQFVLGVGMACAVTALPILVLLMEKLAILREPLGQRILRFASLDDVAIWAVLALILVDWQRVLRQLAFMVLLAASALCVRAVVRRLPAADRWYASLIWLLVCGLGADWCGLHFMVGAFLAGATLDREWFDQRQLDLMRNHVLLLVMPVFFLSTGLRTHWALGGGAVFAAAAALLVMAVGGKLLGVWIAGRALGWQPGEATVVGWLLQTKALIMIIFVNILLDKDVITSDMFTALLLMAVVSTMLTMPAVTRRLAELRAGR